MGNNCCKKNEFVFGDDESFSDIESFAEDIYEDKDDLYLI
jgi:hypothetical protein